MNIKQCFWAALVLFSITPAFTAEILPQHYNPSTAVALDTLLFDVAMPAHQEDRLKAGEQFTATIKPGKSAEGYQFTLNTPGVEIIDIAGIEKGYYAVFAEAGAATFSVDGPSVDATISLRLRAIKGGKLSELINISSRITRSEAYIGGKRQEVGLRFISNSGEKTINCVGFELYQNQPNPFVDRTSIGFYLPQAETATLTVYDETGRLLHTQKNDFPRGYNKFRIDKPLLNAPGTLFYKVETSTESASKTMLQTTK